MNRERLIADIERSTAAYSRHGQAPDIDHDKTYGVGKWTVRQMMAHVADTEFINLSRFCFAVAEPGSSVAVFDEQAWSHELDYATRPVTTSRAMILACRETLTWHVRTLSDDHLARTGHHPEKGEMSGWEWARLIHDHDDHHLGQIEAAREGRVWVAPPVTGESWRYRGMAPPK